eukprot:scaffold11166_cov101-Isochrysis_galbana.AAC.1
MAAAAPASRLAASAAVGLRGPALSSALLNCARLSCVLLSPFPPALLPPPTASMCVSAAIHTAPE